MVPGPEISVILESHRAVYVEIPKVACTSLKAALAPLVGVDLAKTGGNPHEVDFPKPPDAASRGDRLYPGLFAFSFVRNPWDRLVSCYRDKIAGEVGGFTKLAPSGIAVCLERFGVFSPEMTFDEFVEAVASIPDAAADAHFRSQSSFVMTPEGRPGVDFLGRYETLQRDFERVAARIGLPAEVRLPRLQAAPPGPRYVDYYAANTRRLVADRFGDDIEVFGYRFGG